MPKHFDVEMIKSLLCAERLKGELAERDKQSMAAASAMACKVLSCHSSA